MKTRKCQYVIVVSLFLVFVPIQVFSQTGPARTNPSSATTLEDAIRKELTDLDEAVGRRDITAILSHFADDEGFFYDRDDGRLTGARNKSETRKWVEYLAKSGAKDVFEIKDLGVLQLAPDIALANYVLVLKRTTDGKTETIREAATDVFVLRNGRWLIRAEHAEVLPKLVEPVIAGLPLDWKRSTNETAEGYAITVDTKVHHSGDASASIRFLCSPDAYTWAALAQEIDAAKFKGKRVRLTGWLKTADVGEAALWMRADGEGQRLAFDNMADRFAKGTTDWKQYSIVLDIPENAVNLAFGALVTGNGQAWADDLVLEAVSKDIPVTAPSMNEESESKANLKRSPRSAPINLGFESGAVK